MKKRNNQVIRFLTPPDMQGVQAVYGANVTNEFPRHMHTRLCIGVVQQGSRIISQAGTSVVVPENAMFAINPSTGHACKSKGKEGPTSNTQL